MKAHLLSSVALSAIPLHTSAFAALPRVAESSVFFPLHVSAGRDETDDVGGSGNGGGVTSIDVSDLGLTMADLDKQIPIHDFSFESSGYQSTSRIPDVNDSGCFWSENPEDVDVTLRIPGLRGQPAEALSVLFSTTTVSVTAFGRTVWSCIQMGISDTDDCTFLTEEGEDGIPIIQLNVKKRDTEERWGGFVLQIGEDSIL
mmetsp:Transcript_26562/g.56503  ORF Transcript_26562/g.56503 Transcript_26562/m.56503 type:complete len:201 (-) Transcript_26562:491-1093(-)|eukprot:CAMPEP_0172551536 /NCGR_PEP_ID=MMETSP1067-20121228/40060_1 /TAXON_ID=265564 ORGANISM="Thalassiosira punctigera, Strain Tpunct2005C2" /NCGR_SAMPLE_ID=MMETSP1067 /ASSEMBLY_ACC=CAM_ASM_000444 /LENGTH=200 /DNA_ID=CAMNT_0013339341 /DNA_START=62 /DNA_END=664 /DNA_ORIENTATION=-